MRYELLWCWVGGGWAKDEEMCEIREMLSVYLVGCAMELRHSGYPEYPVVPNRSGEKPSPDSISMLGELEGCEGEGLDSETFWPELRRLLGSSTVDHMM